MTSSTPLSQANRVDETRQQHEAPQQELGPTACRCSVRCCFRRQNVQRESGSWFCAWSRCSPDSSVGPSPTPSIVPEVTLTVEGYIPRPLLQREYLHRDRLDTRSPSMPAVPGLIVRQPIGLSTSRRWRYRSRHRALAWAECSPSRRIALSSLRSPLSVSLVRRWRGMLPWKPSARMSTTPSVASGCSVASSRCGRSATSCV